MIIDDGVEIQCNTTGIEQLVSCWPKVSIVDAVSNCGITSSVNREIVIMTATILQIVLTSSRCVLLFVCVNL